MPRKRLDKELWGPKRERIWLRDGKICTHCGKSVLLDKCHIDHKQSGKYGSNADWNLKLSGEPLKSYQKFREQQNRK